MTKLQRVMRLMERHGNNPKALAETLDLVLQCWYATIALAAFFALMWITCEVLFAQSVGM